MQRRRIHRLVAVLAATAVLVTACGDDDDGGEASGSSTTAAAAAFPVTVTAANGEVEVPAEPQRIVSLSPSLTEVLYAIDAGDQVVAVDKSSNFPAGVPATEMSGFSPNVEAIAGYTPDLVVLSRDKDGVAASLTGLGVPTLVLESADTLDDVYEQIDVLGDATGHPAEADELATTMRGDIEELVASLPVRDAPLTYFYELTDEYHSATSDTFIGQVLSLVGLRSIADGVDEAAEGFPQLTAEFVLDQDPDFIFLSHTDSSGTDLAAVAARPGWSELRAVQDDHVVVLPDDVASRWGPRVVELLERVVAALDTAETSAPTGGEE